MKRIHYAWIICGTCTLMLFCTLGMTVSTFSVYMPYINEKADLSQFQSSMLPTIRGLTSLLSMFIVEQFIRKLGIRMAMTVIMGLSCVTFILFGLAETMIAYTIAMALSGFMFGLGGMVPVSILINRWFDAHRALAIGICAAGTGVAAIVLPPFVTMIIENYSLSTVFFVQAVIIFVIGVIVFLFLRNEPAEKRMVPLNRVEKRKVGINRKKREPKNADRKTSLFMMFGVFCVSLISYGTLPYITVLFIDVGVDPMKVSISYSCYGIALMICKFVYGHMTDTLGDEKSFAPFFVIYVAGIFLCCFATHMSYPLVVITMIMHGIAMPLTTVGVPVFAEAISSKEDFPSKLRTMQIFFMAGSMIAGPITGTVAEAVGRYEPAFAVHAFIGIIGFLCTVIAYRRILRTNIQPNP